MSISQQLAHLLSASPGNLVYHLVTLFALQAALALAWWQARRDRGDEQARRVAWATAALLLTRLLLLLAALATAVIFTNPDQGGLVDVAFLPPLEQALNTFTALCLAWALVPRFRRTPRLLDAILGIGVLLTTIIYIFFASDWYTLVRQGAIATPYNASPHTLIWGGLQLGILLAAIAAILRTQPDDHWLRLLILGMLALGHFAHLWNYPEPFPPASEIPYWIRLGQLIALPLLTAFTYRANLRRLLLDQMVNRPQAEQVAAALRQATPPLTMLAHGEAIAAAATLVTQLIPTHFAGIAVPGDDSDGHLLLVSIKAAQSPQTWRLKLDDWPALRLVLTQQQPAELSPTGLGARQLFALYQELGVAAAGPLKLQPLLAEEATQGVLLLATDATQPAWSAADLILVEAVAAYLGALLAVARRFQTATTRLPGLTEQSAGELTILRRQRDEAVAELQAIKPRLAERGPQAMAQPEAAARITSLETEVTTLRAALTEAEAAMALAATQTELSPEWVMHTVTRYSAELEEAHSRLQQLQEALVHKNQPYLDQAVVALAQELRSPIMVIAGYTELLLSETIGALNEPQRDFLRRLKDNSERMGILLQQIIHMAEPDAPKPALVAPAIPADAIAAATDAIMGQLRQKNLRLCLDVSPDLPLLSLEQEHLYQIVVYLLENACRASANGGSVRLRANHLQQTTPTGIGLLGFFHLTVGDAGKGILPQDRGRVFDQHLSADEPLIAGLGETGVGLATVRNLVAAHGGRVWVDSEVGQGSTFTVLLPILTSSLTQGQNSDGPG